MEERISGPTARVEDRHGVNDLDLNHGTGTAAIQKTLPERADARPAQPDGRGGFRIALAREFVDRLAGAAWRRIKHNAPSTGNFWNLWPPTLCPLVARWSRRLPLPRPRADALHELFSLALRSCVKEANMTSNLARVVMISAALAGSAALAQTNDAGSQDNTSTIQPVHKATAPAADQPADMFVTKQAVTEWRAPKLVGVSVYGWTTRKSELSRTFLSIMTDRRG